MPHTICLNGKLINCSQPQVMGILNITPDSFYDGGKYLSEFDIKNRVTEIIEQGATIIDIGAYSSRPGATDVPEAEELYRLQTALTHVKAIAPHFPLSIDTFRANIVTNLYHQFGSFIVNDISGGNADSHMFATVAQHHLPYILMHMRGTPQTMQTHTNYTNLETEILNYFAQKLQTLHSLGHTDCIIDPGFGFSKTLDQNYQLLSILNHFTLLEKPILVGISRKSMIYKLLNTDSAHSLNGTTILHTIALQKGATLLRAHDVRQAVEAITITQKLNHQTNLS